jgi:hypothetical protein
MVYIDLNDMVRSGRKISPSHICIVSFYSTAVVTLKMEDIYLTNEDITGIEAIRNDAVENAATYDLLGRQVHQKNLRPGIYLKDGKKILIK